MSKPPPSNEWQPPQAERRAHGTVNYPPTAGAAGNSLFQHPLLNCWPMLQAQSFAPDMSLLQQCRPLMPPVQSAQVPLSLVNNAHECGRNDSSHHSNCNDLDTTTIEDLHEKNSNVGTTDKATSTTAAHGSYNIPDNDTETLYLHQIFPNKTAYDTAVEKYCNDRNYDINNSTTINKANDGTCVTYYRTTCIAYGVFKSRSTGGENSRIKQSQKKGCKFKITGRLVTPADILRSNGSLTEGCVKVVTLDLEHTNGCKGADELVRATKKQLRGRKYTNTQLSHLKKECMSGRYTTTNVKDWLTEQGHTDVTLKEATNLRYRLIKGANIQGFVDDTSEQAMGKMTDYLLNYDLKQEIEAGGQKSVENLVCVHKGLASQIPGYDYRMTTDSENRFSGTAWQTGRMRRRLRDSGTIIFVDDSRSGINTAGFCFWNVVVIDHNGKVQTVMGAMTMSPTDEAVYWVLSSMVEMTPEAADIVQCLMSDLGVGVDPVQRAMPNIAFYGACTWHIMTIDFPKNVGHIADYDNCKNFVYNKLVRNTVDKVEWENYLLDACQQWPGAASYLQELAKTKERWGAPWRYERFTGGYESSSPVEGSFSSFQRSLDDGPTSFVGVVQSHVRKDREKLQEERVFTNRDNIARTDPRSAAHRTDAENDCAKLFSTRTTDMFEESNRNSQNYDSKEVTISPAQVSLGATEVHEVSRRAVANVDNPRRPRIVMKINGKFCCSCMRDINMGLPCKHIQCVIRGAFLEQQFSTHWRKRDSVVEDPSVGRGPDSQEQHITNTATTADLDSADLDNMVVGDEDSSSDFIVGQVDGMTDGVGVFVTEYAQAASTSTSTGTVQTKRRPKRKLDHKQKYNNCLEEAKQIASIASSENEETYFKVMGVLKWIRSNIQNKTAEEVKVASADYLGIALSSSSSSTEDATGSNDDGTPALPLPPILRRSAGSTSTKRYKNCVEIVGKRKGACKFCDLIGHNIKQCSAAKKIGIRLTKQNWNAQMGVVKLVDGKSDTPIVLDTIVPSDAMGLQIVGCVCDGQRSDASDHGGTIYCCKVVLKGLKLKVARDMWFNRVVIDHWTREGTSTCHYVFVKE